MKIEIAQPHGFSFIGMKPNNEDSIFPDPSKASGIDSLFLVCDGVGGRDKGEVASAELCTSLSHSIKSDFNQPFSQTNFKLALQKAYDRLDLLEDAQVSLKMGTTLTFLKFHIGGAMIAHIGDSRVYHIRPAAKTPILFRTEDHSLVASLVKAGMITEDEAAVHPKKNVILRAVQPHQDEPAEADIYETDDLKPGDYFFLCTDGVLENLTDDLLVSILKNNKPDKNKIDEIKAICEGKTKDNYSALLVHIKNISKKTDNKLKSEVLVLDEAAPNPISPKDNFKRSIHNVEKNKWIRVLLASFIIVLAIVLFAYQHKNKKLPTGQPDSSNHRDYNITKHRSDSTKNIKEIEDINVKIKNSITPFPDLKMKEPEIKQGNEDSIGLKKKIEPKLNLQ